MHHILYQNRLHLSFINPLIHNLNFIFRPASLEEHAWKTISNNIVNIPLSSNNIQGD